MPGHRPQPFRAWLGLARMGGAVLPTMAPPIDHGAAIVWRTAPSTCSSTSPAPCIPLGLAGATLAKWNQGFTK